MILGYHLIISAYGFWLPNDPRGSWSEIVRSPKLLTFGEATKVDTHHSVARRPHDRAERLAAKKALDLPPVVFTGIQARAVARGFQKYVEKSGVTVWACVVMPDHAHVVVARHDYDIEVVGNLMKGEATKQLNEEDLHPFRGRQGPKNRVPSCFARKWWVVYQDSEEDLVRTIKYVEDNPGKAGLKPQRWPFVVGYPARYTKPADTAAPQRDDV